MALVLANRVQETTTTTGTGTITLAGAVSGYQSFAVIGNGNTTYYTITSGTAWEVGIGTYSTTGPTLARTTILSSSAGGAAITLAGTSTVFVTYPSNRSVNYDEVNSLTLSGTAISAPAWTTAGIGIKQTATTFTDTTSSGTVADIRINNFAVQTLAASSSTTVTVLYGTYFSEPTPGTNVTTTNRYGLGADSIRVVNGVDIAGTGSNFVTLGGSTTTGQTILGSTSQTGTITLGRSTVSQTTNIQAAATASGSTKTINLGTGGLSGSTTTITIGSATSGATQTTTINGRVTLAPIGASAAAWTTGGIALVQSAATFTDTTSTGTVADIRINNFGAQTLAASSAVTATNLYGTYFNSPVAGTNVTATNRWAIAADSIISFGAVVASGTGTFAGAFNMTTVGFNISLGTAQTTGLLTLGGPSQTATMTVGQSTVSQTTNIQAGATASGSTKTINIGTGSLAGSTTTITIGSGSGTCTVGINGPVTVAGSVSATSATSRAILGTDSGGSISLGRVDNNASSPYIDFNSGATTADFDTRIAGTSGTGTSGQGTLTITASTIAVTGVLSAPLGSAAAPSYTFTGDTNTGMWSPGADTIAFSEGGVEAMRIDSSGNVGIGTSSPSTYGKFVVAGTGVVISSVVGDATGEGQIIYSNVTAGRVTVTGAFPLIFQTNSNERMRISAAGDVGIGTVSPGAKLDVSGTVNFSGALTSGNLADAVGYKGVPQNSQTASYTLALTDMGKHISITTGGVVIPANSSVAFPIGSTITVYNNSGTAQNISITTDTLRLSGTATTGTRSLAQRGLATCIKVANTEWVVTGNVT